uniref:Unannotated protein n=1 Tax=freshwater metagenome TaxID=449393 RepID=A0A6J5ZC59_9ZZZZ
MSPSSVKLTAEVLNPKAAATAAAAAWIVAAVPVSALAPPAAISAAKPVSV